MNQIVLKVCSRLPIRVILAACNGVAGGVGLAKHLQLRTGGNMIDNPCLRLACLSDVLREDYVDEQGARRPVVTHESFSALVELYTAEWNRRGFERSP